MRRTIAILGAGFSGTLVAMHLLRQRLGDRLRLVLVERTGRFGRGLAYGTWDDNLLLNVPAGNMSALADDPGHFVSYIRNIDPNFNSGSFLPRRIYGDYLEDTLARAQRDGDSVLEKIAGEAVALRRDVAGTGYIVQLADGRRIPADQVVLALGHGPPGPLPASAELRATIAYVADPWAAAALDRIDRDRPVALLGTGHTAIDTLFRLTARSGPGRCFLISRRGLLPHAHRRTPRQPTAVALPAYLAQDTAATARGYLHAVRSQARRRQAAGEDWRDVVNELRPHTPALWQRLCAAERRRFIDRVLPYWDIHRHRLAPSAHLRLQRLLDSGQARVLAGRVLGYEARGTDIGIALRQRSDGRTSQVTVGTVVNCTGPDYDIVRAAHPLLEQLRADGLVRADPLRQGLQVDPGYRVIDRDGRAVPSVFYLGPLLKATLWEAIAVPELRVHAARLVRQMVAAGAPSAAIRVPDGTADVPHAQIDQGEPGR
jgi:uncharacterized NAD(P)/FAD-binding protein YdhS